MLITRLQYILPKQAKPLEKKIKLAPGAERSLTVSLKSLRNPPLDITLKAQPPTTSILDLKSAIHEQTSIPVNKLRVLHNKKPVTDSKVLKDLVKEDESSIEFSVMVIGGAPKKGDEEVIPDAGVGKVAQGESGLETLKNEEFWSDLKGFLTQRLRDEAQGEKVYGLFRGAWDAQE
jgi:hypothetical protein